MRTWEREQAIETHKLSWPMIGALETGHASTHSAGVLGRSQTIKALQRRGLIGQDRRWTRLGHEVARVLLVGHVYTMDGLHLMAIHEDRQRGN